MRVAIVESTTLATVGYDENLTRHSRNQTGKLVTMPEWASNY
jgi:hypothetical protein